MNINTVNILKIIVLFNAINMGWSVKRINNNEYELTKMCSNNNVNIEDDMNSIIKTPF